MHASLLQLVAFAIALVSIVASADARLAKRMSSNHDPWKDPVRGTASEGHSYRDIHTTSWDRGRQGRLYADEQDSTGKLTATYTHAISKDKNGKSSVTRWEKPKYT